MKKEEYDKLKNFEKVNFLNRYQGKTKEFSTDNDFSWSYATSNCKFVKDGNLFVAKDGQEKNEYEEKILKAFEYKSKSKRKVNVTLVEEYIDKISEEKEGTAFSTSDIINFALYKYFEKSDYNE